MDNFLPLQQGVSFFFVLSGFILGSVYPTLTRSRLRDFYTARIARVWPAHVAVFILLLATVPKLFWTFDGHPTLPAAVANVSLIHGWIPSRAYYFSYNGVTWSLSVEFFFYALFPVLIWLVARRPRVTLLGTCLLGLVTVGFIFFFHRSPNLAYVSPLARLPEFVLGILVARFCGILRQSGWQAESRSAKTWTLLEIGTLGLAMTVAWFGAKWVRATIPNPDANAWDHYLEGALAFPFFALLIAVFSFEKGILSRLLSLGWLAILGEISFSIYLLHPIIVQWWDLLSAHFSLWQKQLLYPFFWLVVLALSYLLWQCVEKPFQRLLRHTFGSKKIVVPGVLPAEVATQP